VGKRVVVFFNKELGGRGERRRRRCHEQGQAGRSRGKKMVRRRGGVSCSVRIAQMTLPVEVKMPSFLFHQRGLNGDWGLLVKEKVSCQE
jgi:hypothetical protein